MEVVFLETPFKGEVELCKETLNYLKKKKYKKIALSASVQFIHSLNEVKKQLNELNIQIISTTQLLGCEMYFLKSHSSGKNADAFLYVGDGRFHPLALLYAQKEFIQNDLINYNQNKGNRNIKENQFKEVICNDPIGNKFSLLSFDEVKPVLKKYHASLTKFLMAKNIGVIISLKPGQINLKNSLSLEKKFPEKNFYYFVDNNISFEQLENFPFIELWVNTACPRIAFDEQIKFRKGVVNLRDILNL